MIKLFTNKSKELQVSIDSFLDRVETSSLLFLEGIKAYLKDQPERFEKYRMDTSKLESEADNYRRDIKYKLYTYMLIPESRGDVLGLLETMDDVVDVADRVLQQFSIEQPQIPDYLRQDFHDLAELSQKAVDALVNGARAFFTQINLVNNFVNKVHFYEHEADQLEVSLKRKIFQCIDVPQFSRKVHMRHFAEQIAMLSDEAESVAERMAVYAIKRRI
ncbi:MAG: DUF47 family protein [Candidatus Cloacimonetes bacterium]|nr:DUF47 family protein [Candidatus Cloacimonadota bacterium]